MLTHSIQYLEALVVKAELGQLKEHLYPSMGQEIQEAERLYLLAYNQQYHDYARTIKSVQVTIQEVCKVCKVQKKETVQH